MTEVRPAQIAFYGPAFALVALALRGRRAPPRTLALGWLGLGLLWAWTGVAYHWWHFSAINRPARVFGTLFLLQAVLLDDNRLQKLDSHGTKAAFVDV